MVVVAVSSPGLHQVIAAAAAHAPAQGRLGSGDQGLATRYPPHAVPGRGEGPRGRRAGGDTRRPGDRGGDRGGPADRSAVRLARSRGSPARRTHTERTIDAHRDHERYRWRGDRLGFQERRGHRGGYRSGAVRRFIESAFVRAFANVRAAIFAQGMVDMVELVEASGGRGAPWSAWPVRVTSTSPVSAAATGGSGNCSVPARARPRRCAPSAAQWRGSQTRRPPLTWPPGTRSTCRQPARSNSPCVRS